MDINLSPFMVLRTTHKEENAYTEELFFPDTFNNLKRFQPAELTLHLLKINHWIVTTEAQESKIKNKFIRGEELDKQARCSSFHFKAVVMGKADPRENPLAIILKEKLPSSTSGSRSSA